MTQVADEKQFAEVVEKGIRTSIDIANTYESGEP